MKNAGGNEILLQGLILISQNRGLSRLHFLLAVVITPRPARPGLFPRRTVGTAPLVCTLGALGLWLEGLKTVLL